MANLESNQTADVLKELMPALLQLGSDSDEVVRTLFQHLVRPMMFYFSSKFQAHTNSVKVVFEALMVSIFILLFFFTTISTLISAHMAHSCLFRNFKCVLLVGSTFSWRSQTIQIAIQ